MGAVLDDARYLDANVDFGNLVGYFVRLDVEVPQETFTTELPGPDDSVPHHWLALSPDRPKALGASLIEMAARGSSAPGGPRMATRILDATPAARGSSPDGAPQSRRSDHRMVERPP